MELENLVSHLIGSPEERQRGFYAVGVQALGSLRGDPLCGGVAEGWDWGIVEVGGAVAGADGGGVGWEA